MIEHESNLSASTWLDLVLVVRSFVIWALLLGQAALIVMFHVGVSLDIQHIACSLLVGGVVGLAGHILWLRGWPI